MMVALPVIVDSPPAIVVCVPAVHRMVWGKTWPFTTGCAIVTPLPKTKEGIAR